MSILIKGMEMPKNGETITITICDDGVVFEEWKEPGSVFKAISVQPHGRLCDLDALIKSLELELKRHNSKQFTANWNDACLCVLEAPVVIEAEEGE